MNRYIKDAVFGMIGGIAGTFVIGKVMGAMSKLQSEEDKQLERELIKEEPKEKLARMVVEDAFGFELEDDTRTALAQGINWGYGIFWGGVYGVLRKQAPAVSWGAGLPFGIAFALFGQAVALPAMGLTPPAHKFPLSAMARGLVSHYAYAATVEGVCTACEAIEQKATHAPMRTKTELRRVS